MAAGRFAAAFSAAMRRSCSHRPVAPTTRRVVRMGGAFDAPGVRSEKRVSARVRAQAPQPPSFTPSFSPEEPMTSHGFRIRRADDLDARQLLLTGKAYRGGVK